MSGSRSVAKIEKGLALVTFWLLFLMAVDIGFRVVLSVTSAFGDDDLLRAEDHRVKSAPYRAAPSDVEGGGDGTMGYGVALVEAG